MAGLEAQQAQKPAVGADDCVPPLPGRGHGQPGRSHAGPGQDDTARQAAKRRGTRIIRSRTAGDIATLDHGGQATCLSDDQRGVHMVIAKEPPHVSHRGSRGKPLRMAHHGISDSKAIAPVIRSGHM